MATQSVEFRAATGQTITAKLFAAGSDTEVASVSATEATNRKGTYVAAYTDIPAGEYQLIAFNATSIPVAAWWVTLTLMTATFPTYDKADTRDVFADTTNIKTRLPAVLVSGRIDSSVGAYQSGLAPPTAAANATAVRSELTTELGRIDVAVSSRLASGSYTAPDNASVAAIKAKTDNLPSDPADASDIAAAFVTVNSKLDAIDDYVDSEVSAIKAVTDKLDGMLVLDGLVYQYTANALELGGSSGTVYVYPMSMEQEPRNTHAKITVYTGETGSQYFFAYDSTGAALSLTGKTLEFRVANTQSKQVLYTAKTSDGTLTISLGNKVTFTRSLNFTRYEMSSLEYSLRDVTAGNELLLKGPMKVTWAP